MSLTTVAEQTRAMVIVGGIMTVVSIFAYIAWGIGVEYYKAANPTPPPQPDYAFNALPPIEFPEDNVSDYTYNFEAIDSRITPIRGYYFPVYEITNNKRSSGFFSLDRANEQAAALGFILEPRLISGTKYRWTRTNPIPATLDMDSVNNTFELDVAWETDPSFLSESARPSPQQALKEFTELLEDSGYMPADLFNGTSKTTLLQYNGTRFSEALSLSEADFIQVDLFRKNIAVSTPEIEDQILKVLPPDPNKGLARGLVSGNRTQGKRIVDVDYQYMTINYDNPGTYPYITPAQAFELLQSGTGYVAIPPEFGTTATIREVYPAYYDPLDEDQEYLQPIYVFTGGDEDEFTAYVPAVNPSIIVEQ